MRQLTASEASNDEMERQRFENAIRDEFGCLVNLNFCENGAGKNGAGEYSEWLTHVAWAMWQAALKSKQGEV